MATRTTVGGADESRPEPPHVEVIATVSRCVMTLEQIGAAADLDSHQVAEHIDRLTQQLAGAAIDALRAWPS